MDVLKALELLTIVLGLCSVGLSGRWCLYFMTSRHGIGRSVAFMTLGEAASSTVMTTFAIMVFTDTRQYASPWLLAAMRLAMFTIVTASTIHLALQVRKITEEMDRAEAERIAIAEASEALQAVVDDEVSAGEPIIGLPGIDHSDSSPLEV